MDRDTGWVVLAALLCCLAVVLAAATLPSMIESGGDGGFGGTGDGGFDEPADEIDEPSNSDSEPWLDVQLELPELCISVLDSLWGFLGLALGAVGIAALVTRSSDLTLTIALSIVLLLLVVLVFAVLTGGCGAAMEEPSSPDEAPPLEEENSSSGSFGDGDETVPGPTLPSLLVLAVLLVTVVAAVAALVYTDGSGGSEPATADEQAEDDVQRSALGRAAGQAADRIESGDDFENEIYRAWREMTDPLEVDRPASSTPGEFAAAARDAGLDPSHVDELRTMFEDVRYGDRPVTDDRERRAVEILRRIEDVYGDDDGATANGGTN